MKQTCIKKLPRDLSGPDVATPVLKFEAKQCMSINQITVGNMKVTTVTER